MSLEVIKTTLPGVLILEPKAFHDSRGFFIEAFHQKKYAGIGIDRVFVQDNRSHSIRDTLRGLHYQLRHPQAKLVFAISGEIYDVAVDIRKGSPAFGQSVGVKLSGKNGRQIYVPEGFAHGFCVLSETADVMYKCTDFYTPGDEYGILWSDPALGIEWPVEHPLLSEKDSKCPKLSDAPGSDLPDYK